LVRVVHGLLIDWSGGWLVCL